jgi:hypothetical protein
MLSVLQSTSFPVTLLLPHLQYTRMKLPETPSPTIPDYRTWQSVMLYPRDTWFKSLSVLWFSRLMYFIVLNILSKKSFISHNCFISYHSQPILYDPVLPVLPTLQVINNATGKQIIGRHILTSGEYHHTAKSNYQIPTKSQHKAV